MHNKLGILKNLRILFMEDEHDLFELYKEILSEFFLEVVGAIDGEKGLDIYKEYTQKGQTIDLVLSDINMPNMNGLDCAKELLKLNNQLPILFLTGHNDSNYIMESINIGASGYILKPVDTLVLIDKLFKAYLPVYQSKVIGSNSFEKEENTIFNKVALEEEDDCLNIGELLDSLKKEVYIP